MAPASAKSTLAPMAWDVHGNGRCGVGSAGWWSPLRRRRMFQTTSWARSAPAWPIVLRTSGIVRGTRCSGYCWSSVLEAEGGDERLLGNLDAADGLHAPLALLLLFQQLLLAGDIAAVALGD